MQSSDQTPRRKRGRLIRAVLFCQLHKPDFIQDDVT